MAKKTYKLLRGRHVEGRGDDRKTYKRSDRITTDKDLLKFNKPGIAPKFELLSIGREDAEETGEAAPSLANDALEDLTVAQLRHIAEEEEIDLGGAARKDEIIARIRAAQ